MWNCTYLCVCLVDNEKALCIAEGKLVELIVKMVVRINTTLFGLAGWL
jgi:hypothetical protein